MNTDQTPLTDQQLNEIKALTKNVPAGPWTVDNSRAELHGSHGNLLADLWDDRLGVYFAAMHAATPALLAEVRRLKGQRKYLLTQLAKRDAESGRSDEALREFLADEPDEEAHVVADGSSDPEHAGSPAEEQPAVGEAQR